MPKGIVEPLRLNGFSDKRAEAIRQRYDPDQIRFISAMLDDGKARIIDETAALMNENGRLAGDVEALGADDYLICAEIEFICAESPDDLAYYDNFHVTGRNDEELKRNQEQYIRLSGYWVMEEQAQLRRRLGKEPTYEELKADARTFNTARRFRTYMVKKRPDMMKEEG